MMAPGSSPLSLPRSCRCHVVEYLLIITADNSECYLKFQKTVVDFTGGIIYYLVATATHSQITKRRNAMAFFLHELMELVLLISAVAVTWAVPRPQWVSRAYTRIARFFGSQRTFN